MGKLRVMTNGDGICAGGCSEAGMFVNGGFYMGRGNYSSFWGAFVLIVYPR